MYATAQDLIDRFGVKEMTRLSVPGDRSAEQPDTDVLERVIADASSFCDGYLRARYRVPVESPTRDLVQAVCHLARHELANQGAVDPTQQMTESRADTIRWLEQIASNRIDLGLPKAAGGEAPTRGASYSGRQAKIQRDELAGL
ncbi:MAG: DUF1320 domain-containing protein [Ahrensia sp.]|nr:DUF1320 domain-containing protein [Ahrensia sp.]